MQNPSNPSLVRPISLVAGAILIGVAMSVLSLGVLIPLAGVLIGLSLILSGVWLLLNRTSKASRVAASVLVFLPLLVHGVFLLCSAIEHK